MTDPPTWEVCANVVGGTVIGSVLVFLMDVAFALLIRWVTGVRVREPPAVALFVAGEIVDLSQSIRNRLLRLRQDQRKNH